MVRKILIIAAILMISTSIVGAEEIPNSIERWFEENNIKPTPRTGFEYHVFNFGAEVNVEEAEISPTKSVDQTKEKDDPIFEVYQIFLEYTSALLNLPIIIVFFLLLSKYNMVLSYLQIKKKYTI